MTVKRWWLLLAASLLVVSAIGCTRGRSDAQIVSDVIGRINADRQVTSRQISITSDNGVVTLSGQTASEAERTAAANDAAHVEGVKTVVNNLVAAPAPQQAAVENAPAQPAPVEVPAPLQRAPERTHKPTAYHPTRHASATDSDMPIVSSPALAPSPAPASVASANNIPSAVLPSVPAPPPPPKPVAIPSGTTLSVRMVDPIDSGRNQPGDIFQATLDSPVTIDDQVVIPEGAGVTGRVVAAKAAGHFAGQPQLALELASLSVNGRKYTLSTNQYTQQGASRGARTAKTVGSGAAIGAIIGAIAGGGKGAAIGAAAGAGVGGGVEAATKPQQVHIPSEALLSFRLQAPITVTPAAAQDRSGAGTHWSAPASNTNQWSNPSEDDTTFEDSGTPPDNDRPVLKRRPSGDPANPPE